MSPPPPSVPLHKSSTTYPAVHPVPEPSAQTGFSSVTRSTAERDDNKFYPSPSHTDLKETDQTSSRRAVSSSRSNRPSTAIRSLSLGECSSPPVERSRENGHDSLSSPAASLRHKDNCEGMNESEKERVRRAAQETFSDEILAENHQPEVTACWSLLTASLITLTVTVKRSVKKFLFIFLLYLLLPGP